MRHRPIKKVEKTPNVLIGAVLINLAIIGIYYSAFSPFKEHGILHWTCLYGSLLCLVILIPSFVLSSAMDPDYV